MSNQVLTASAGTGKTYRLSVEYIKCLLEMFDKGGDENCFRHILVITFTRKATAEIRSRVFKQLKDLLERKHESDVYGTLSEQRKHELSNDEFVWLEKVYHNMCVNRHKIQIRTIDGFINSIFTDVVARLLNINNINVVADDHKDDIYLMVMEKLWENDNLRRIFSDIYLKQEVNIKEVKTTAKCLDIIRNIINARDKFVLRDDEMLVPNKERAANYLKEAQRFYAEFIDNVGKVIGEKKDKANPDEKFLGKSAGEFKEDIRQLADVPAGLGKVSAFCEILKDKICNDDKWLKANAEILLKDYVPSQIVNGHKVSLKEFKDEYDEKIRVNLMSYLFYSEIASHNQAYQAMFDEIYRIYDEIVLTKQEFTHNDVLLRVYQAMSNPKFEFSRQLSADYKYVMIDEFQDTSVLQWASLLPILKPLAKADGVIIVGDEKQAIYGWRGGEKELLGKVSEILEIKPENLDTSYRSYHNVIQYVNEIFADEESISKHEQKSDKKSNSGSYLFQNDVMTSVNGELDLQWKCPVVKCDKDSENEKGCFEIYFDRYNNATNDHPKERKKTQCIEDFIEEVVIPKIKNKSIPDYDKRYGQTAILARKNNILEEIAAVLNRHNIPTYIESNCSLFSQNAVIGVMALLRYLAFEDYHSFFEFVRSPIINANSTQTQELLRHYRDNKMINYENEKLIADYPFLSRVANLRNEYNSSTSFFSLISRIYNDFGIQSAFKDVSDTKSLHQLLDIALQFDTGLVDYTKSLAGFLLYTDDIYAETKPDGVDETNAVKLMTIHKSKGLEFDNVFVLNVISSKGNNFSEPLKTLYNYNEDLSKVENFTVMKRKFYTALTKCKNYKFDDGCLTQLKKIIVDSDKKEFIGEMNNFYVALTRPAMNLVVYNIIDSSVECKKECEKIGVGKDGHPESLLKDKNIVLALYKKYIAADIDNAQKDKIYERYIDEDHRVYSFCDGQWELVPPKKKSDDNQKVSQNFIFDKMGEYIRYDLWQPDIESARAAKLNDKEFDENIENAKTSFGERKRLFGIAVHYYMSKIIYADKEEKRLAHRALYMKYGNILDNEAIDKAACVADKFISKFAYLFDRNKWNRVLNEQWLTAVDGSLRRLDRIMFNTDTHEILIADYKTGKEDKEQLKEYTELVKDKVGNGWTIDAKNFFL